MSTVIKQTDVKALLRVMSDVGLLFAIILGGNLPLILVSLALFMLGCVVSLRRFGYVVG